MNALLHAYTHGTHARHTQLHVCCPHIPPKPIINCHYWKNYHLGDYLIVHHVEHIPPSDNQQTICKRHEPRGKARVCVCVCALSVLCNTAHICLLEARRHQDGQHFRGMAHTYMHWKIKTTFDRFSASRGRAQEAMHVKCPTFTQCSQKHAKRQFV